MNARFRKYRPDPDSRRIRDLLVDARQAFDECANEAVGFRKRYAGYTWTKGF